MPGSVDIYQILVNQYTQLPWYKKASFWLSAPRLAWGLFGYKQHPDETRIKQLFQRAKVSWLFKTQFEREIQKSTVLTLIISTLLTQRNEAISSEDFGINNNVLAFALTYLPPQKKRGHELLEQIPGVKDLAHYRETKVSQLLLAVVYGMESEESNTPVQAKDVLGLFDPDVFAKELLKNCPALLLERGDVTDWAGRTFKNITAFEYALWAKDFQMLEMMLDCIPSSLGEGIQASLFEQAKQVKAPIEAGGGLTYTHTYDRPNLDASGIPNGTMTTVIEEHTENHFDLTPLCAAYQDYQINYNARSWPQCIAYWTKIIGTLQHLLPVHILQRYCDQESPFYRQLQFNDEFKRTTDFYNCLTRSVSSLFGSSLSSDFALAPGLLGRSRWGFRRCPGGNILDYDRQALQQLDIDSTRAIETITQLLSEPQHSVVTFIPRQLRSIFTVAHPDEVIDFMEQFGIH